MTQPTETVKSNLLELLEETFETPRGMYLDRPKGGLLITLGAISAEVASKETGSQRSIAAHAEHLRVYLAALHRYISGATGATDWDASWATHGVNNLEWTALQRDLKRDYLALKADLERIPDGDLRLAEGIAILAHSAYHFGAIRQLLRRDLSQIAE